MKLADVLAPGDKTAFLQDYVGQRHLVIRNEPERFRTLVTWDALSEALSRLEISNKRVSLVKNGNGLPEESYVCSSRDGTVKWLDGPMVTKHIAAGATLVVNRVDMLLPALRHLAESCEDVFEIPIGANLYAGWRTDNGFERHWDTHDTLILQIAGRKDWKVWAPTRLHPLRDDALESVPQPTGAPTWEGTLNAGDLLYMPRGWWHVAFPRNEVSLHVTLGIALRTGMDLLQWALESMREKVEARRDIPHWLSKDERIAWMQELRSAWSDAMSDDAVEAYMHSLTRTAKPRPCVVLGEKVATTPSLTEQSRLRLTAGRRLVFEARRETESLVFSAQGTAWRCAPGLSPALTLLSSTTPRTLRDMEQSVEAPVRPLVRPFVTALLMADVIWAEPEPSVTRV